MTLERAQERAVELDDRTEQEIKKQLFPSAYTVFSELQAYLIRRSEEMETRNSPIQLKHLKAAGVTLIVLGPTIDKGPTPEHFHFDSGARLSLGLTLRELSRRESQLVSFRYHYQLPASRYPAYFRFDLNEARHGNPLTEPRCHLHPGLEDVRIPLSLHHPFEILDRIFFVLERNSLANPPA